MVTSGRFARLPLLGYMVDASSRLSKHTLSYDRLGRATDHYFGSDDAGNTHRMRRQYSYDDSNAGRLTAFASSNDDGLSSGGTPALPSLSVISGVT